MIITPTSLRIKQLFGSTNEQYVIPTYQRRYSRHERQVSELIDDSLLIDESDTHPLGSIVCLAGHHTAGLNHLELVDGQQRLTTVTVILECIRQRLERDGKTDEAAEVARLLSANQLRGKPLRKVARDSIDSTEFDRLVQNDQKEPFQNQVVEAATLPERHLYADPAEADDEGGEEPLPDGSLAASAAKQAHQVSFAEFLARLVHCTKVYGELVLVR